MVVDKGGGGADDKDGNNKYGDGVSWIRGSMIGKGGFGCVYLATLKNPRSKFSYFPSAMAVKSAEVSASASIQKEQEVLSNVKGCPYVIRCYGEETTMGTNGAMVYNLLLEYGSGGTLADRIGKSGTERLPELEVKLLTRSILRGLNHIHGVGYVHCDLKPENILLVPAPAPDVRHKVRKEFRAKIGDFGLAKRVTRQQSKKRKLEPYWRGTPMYLSPEAVLENVQEPPCDVWALGCIVLEMLTGKPPWEKGEETSVEEILWRIGNGRELPKIPAGISNEAKGFLKGCFVRNSKFRLTAEMLLGHPFVEGLDDDCGGEELEGVEDLDEDESMLVLSESDDYAAADDDDSCGSLDWSEDDSLCYLSEEDVADSEEDENVSSISEETQFKEEDIGAAVGNRIKQSSVKKSGKVPAQVPSQGRQHYSVSFTVRAGV